MLGVEEFGQSKMEDSLCSLSLAWHLAAFGPSETSGVT